MLGGRRAAGYDARMNIFTVLAAVLWGNAATAAFIFALVRLRQKDAFDPQSVGAIAFFAVVAISAGYLAV